jgi:hypothetical protein
VGPRASLDLPELELPPVGRPTRSQSLYRLSYPGYYVRKNSTGNCGGSESHYFGVTPRRLMFSISVVLNRRAVRFRREYATYNFESTLTGSGVTLTYTC